MDCIIKAPSIPIRFSVESKPLCRTQSKALDRSPNIMLTYFYLVLCKWYGKDVRECVWWYTPTKTKNTGLTLACFHISGKNEVRKER